MEDAGRYRRSLGCDSSRPYSTNRGRLGNSTCAQSHASGASAPAAARSITPTQCFLEHRAQIMPLWPLVKPSRSPLRRIFLPEGNLTNSHAGNCRRSGQIVTTRGLGCFAYRSQANAASKIRFIPISKIPSRRPFERWHSRLSHALHSLSQHTSSFLRPLSGGRGVLIRLALWFHGDTEHARTRSSIASSP